MNGSVVSKELTCAHCHGAVPHGASVCCGCQAEVEYGAPRGSYWIVVVLALIAMAFVADALPKVVSWIGAIVGLIVLIGGIITMNKLFADRIVFRRFYRSR